MSAPLYVVFEKNLSAKPSLPSPSIRPQSILIKDSPTGNLHSQGLYGRRGSSDSGDSYCTLSHDCYSCGLPESNEDDREAVRRNPFYRSSSGSSSSSTVESTGSITSSIGDSCKPRRVQWADRV
ncbi:hypothetical protein BGW38_009911 [Lunasporangiospora selenospora]|uniref:Uncharacterized protein n=1 Tax=Lunasporangiospora selenospora TaxID=979761 RepID=A0A9P6KHU6_9FUNG|nr:hypothetical protein BGW38_009911 [Lunasporangiospora selenospora]